MSSRYQVPPKLSRERLKDFIALDTLTAQLPLIEVVQKRRRPFVRIWTAYDYEREHGTYTAVYRNGLVQTVTVYPDGREVVTMNRPADTSRRGRKS